MSLEPLQLCSRCGQPDPSVYDIQRCTINIGSYERWPFLCRPCRMDFRLRVEMFLTLKEVDDDLTGTST